MTGTGLFLGTAFDLATGKAGADRFTLDSSDLTTHGVIVGMTGSGKTGLGIVMLEEALLAGIPALVLDPKGDMGNLALTFPRPADQNSRSGPSIVRLG
jgi:DNA helicase HerA-like ATPase